MMKSTPSTPIVPINGYLFRAFRDFLVDNGAYRIHILVDARQVDNTTVRTMAVNNGIVLNIAPTAIGYYYQDHEQVVFDCRFQGVEERVNVPMSAILGISNGATDPSEAMYSWQLPPMPLNQPVNLPEVKEEVAEKAVNNVIHMADRFRPKAETDEVDGYTPA